MPRRQSNRRPDTSTPEVSTFQDEFSRQARQHAPRALQILAELMDSEASPRDKATAAIKIIEWAAGRPQQADKPDANTQIIVHLTPTDDRL